MNHGVYPFEQGTSLATPLVATSGIPFVVGAAPVQAADTPATANVPVYCTGWDEAVEKLGYSDDWEKYPICQFMYSHFKLYKCQPVIFCNVLDIATMKRAVAAADMNVTDHKVTLPIEAINDSDLKVGYYAAADVTTITALAKGTDYTAYVSGENLVIELVAASAAYATDKLNVAYNAADPSMVNQAKIVAGVEAVELCMTTLATVPDTMCVPGWSDKAEVAAVMATKMAAVNGLFRGKALIDADSSSTGATTYSAVQTAKTAANLVDENEILCWPMVTLGDKKFHMSTHVAGLMAQVDTGNGGIPYESPSNKGLQIDGLCLEGGTPVNLTLAQANYLNGIGVVTALNFMTSGWVLWGNYTACYPGNTDVKDYFIPVSRMFDFVQNTVVKTFWGYLDKPMNRRLIDTILDTCNIWLSGLVGSGYLLGARAEFKESENPTTSLMAGIIKIHLYITPPSPAQEIDFVVEYDASYVQTALQG